MTTRNLPDAIDHLRDKLSLVFSTHCGYVSRSPGKVVSNSLPLGVENENFGMMLAVVVCDFCPVGQNNSCVIRNRQSMFDQVAMGAAFDFPVKGRHNRLGYSI